MSNIMDNHKELQEKEEEKEEWDSKILAPFQYMVQLKGKQVRRKILKAFNNWIQIDDEKLNAIYEITDSLHNASLLIDDIEDNSDLRRGQPVAHYIFGNAATINAANLVYFLMFERVLKIVPDNMAIDALHIFVTKFLELHLGQGLEIFWRENAQCPTQEQYLKMVQQKTGGGIELCIQLMQLFSKDKRDYTSLIRTIAEFYQIRDDYANLTSTEYESAKGCCDDLSEGKYSFPLIYVIKNNLVDQNFLDIIKLKPESVELKKQIVDQLRACGSFHYSLCQMRKHKDMIRTEVERLGGNPDLLELLSLLSDFGY